MSTKVAFARWGGWTRHVQIVLVLTLVFSVCSWVLGITWLETMKEEKRYASRYSRAAFSPACVYFATNTIPMATTFASAIELGLLYYGRLIPAVSISWACITFVLWAAETTFVELLQWSADGSQMCGVWGDRSEAVGWALQSVVAIAYAVNIAYIVFAGVAVHKERKARKLQPSIKKDTSLA